MTKKEYINSRCKACGICDGSEYHQYHCPDTDEMDSAWDASREQTIKDVCAYLKSHIDPKLVIYHNNTWCNLDGFIEQMKRELYG